MFDRNIPILHCRGNYVGQVPYTRGTTCSACPAQWPYCYNNALCCELRMQYGHYIVISCGRYEVCKSPGTLLVYYIALLLLSPLRPDHTSIPYFHTKVNKIMFSQNFIYFILYQFLTFSFIFIIPLHTCLAKTPTQTQAPGSVTASSASNSAKHILLMIAVLLSIII